MDSTAIDNNIIDFEWYDEEDGSVLMAADIKSYFEFNRNAIEVLLFKGKKTISVSRYDTQSPMFHRQFRKKYEH